MSDVLIFLVTVSIWAPGIVLALTLHEAAHAWTAWKLGDATSFLQGRVSLNPLRHVDPVGTLLVPAFLLVVGSPLLLGWARSVPVETRNLRRPVEDMGRIALSGPLANMVIAVCAALALKVAVACLGVPDQDAEGVGFVALAWFLAVLKRCLIFNVAIAFFNLIPIPPLDGGRIAVWLLPKSMGRQLASVETYGFAVVVAAVVVIPSIGDRAGVDLDVFGTIIGGMVRVVGKALLEL